MRCAIRSARSVLPPDPADLAPRRVGLGAERMIAVVRAARARTDVLDVLRGEAASLEQQAVGGAQVEMGFAARLAQYRKPRALELVSELGRNFVAARADAWTE